MNAFYFLQSLFLIIAYATLDKFIKFFHTNHMNNFLFALAMIFTFSSNFVAGQSVFVIPNNASLYSEPNFESEVLIELEKGTNLEILTEEENGFLYVKYNETQGYIYYEFVGKTLDEQEKVLSYNATILNNSTVYSLTSNEKICDLEKGKRVFLYQGYDKDKEMLAIQFENEGEILFGLIRIEDVKPDGVNTALIVAISAIVAVVSIIIILLGITNKKRHKKLKKQT